jgi:hypothetical protein
VIKSRDMAQMPSCPGCHVVLPGPSEVWHPRSTASVACHALYGEVLGYEHQHVAELGRWHQLLVDTYAAQHAGERSAPITTAFALIGLSLALERGWSGLRVRDAHQELARRYREWPRFATPPSSATMTVEDLAFTRTPGEYVEALHHWAHGVWETWRHEHHRVEALLAERLPGSAVPDRHA